MSYIKYDIIMYASFFYYFAILKYNKLLLTECKASKKNTLFFISLF